MYETKKKENNKKKRWEENSLEVSLSQPCDVDTIILLAFKWIIHSCFSSSMTWVFGIYHDAPTHLDCSYLRHFQLFFSQPNILRHVPKCIITRTKMTIISKTCNNLNTTYQQWVFNMLGNINWIDYIHRSKRACKLLWFDWGPSSHDKYVLKPLPFKISYN